MATNINGYHAHVYFDAATLDQAKALCQQARDRFSLNMGRVHETLVGPHPSWSCQLAFPPEQFADVINWLSLNRRGLTVFVHPNTGNDYKDHTDYVMWLGQSQELNLSIFEKNETS